MVEIELSVCVSLSLSLSSLCLSLLSLPLSPPSASPLPSPLPPHPNLFNPPILHLTVRSDVLIPILHFAVSISAVSSLLGKNKRTGGGKKGEKMACARVWMLYLIVCTLGWG